MRGSKKQHKFGWAYVPGFLNRREVDFFRDEVRFQTHECDEINDVGTAWEYPLPGRLLEMLFTPSRRAQLATAMGFEATAFADKMCAHFQSAIRTDADILGAHTDQYDDPEANPGREFAVIVYLNDRWQESWGGALRLHLQGNVVLPFYPVMGAAAILEVNKHSLHSVEPVKKGVYRHAFVGWFNDPTKPINEPLATVRRGLRFPPMIPGDLVLNPHLKE